MHFSVRLISRECVQLDCMHSIEYAVLDPRVCLFQLPYQLFCLLPAGVLAVVIPLSYRLRELARAADEFEVVVAAPCQNVLLLDAVHRAYEFHTLKVQAVDLRNHGLQL